ncbi:type III secretion system effector SopF, partial [Salmonella enterica subsp. enterica serovar Infantis]|nr:type III secretion system effector SopF [Salmonella enterica subsp. enterica serovar Infantis]
IIREKALRRISRECGTEIDCTLLLNKMVDILQNARLTINFNAAKIDFVSLLKNKEYLNSYALGCRPGDLPAYNVGRDSVETKAFELERLADSPYAPYGQTGGFSVAYTPNSRTFSPTSRPIYAALDFLNGENGGASAYGKSFFELNDNVKTNCTFSPFDIYGH